MDSLYMVVITIFGVGYGEVQPIQSPALRALTITTIVGGYAAVIYTIGGFVQMLIDGELNRAFGARRMTKGIERLRDHTIVCGFGRMGNILARELQRVGMPLVVIDANESRLQQAEERGYLVIHGDATEEYVLSQAGIEHAAVLASVLSDDATNVFVTITTREMNPRITIIARGENPRTEKKLLGCGADKVVLPTAIGAARVAQIITRPSAEELLEQNAVRGNLDEELRVIGLQFDELKVAPESALVGKELSEIEVHSNHGFLIVAVRKADGGVTINPDAATRLCANDVVIVIGHDDDIPKLAERLAFSYSTTYRGVKVDA